MKLLLLRRGDRELLQGVVSEKRPGTGGGAGKVLNIKLKGTVYNATEKVEEEKELDIAIWNNDSYKMADAATKNLKVGDYVSILCIKEKDAHYTAIAMKASGHWTFPAIEATGSEAEVPERNIIIGTIASGKMSDDKNCYRVSVPVSGFEDGERVTEWKSISFWNSDSAERPSSLATNAEKVLAPYTPSDADETVYRRAAIVCGPANYYMDTMGNERVSFNAYRFERTK